MRASGRNTGLRRARVVHTFRTGFPIPRNDVAVAIVAPAIRTAVAVADAAVSTVVDVEDAAAVVKIAVADTVHTAVAEARTVDIVGNTAG